MRIIPTRRECHPILPAPWGRAANPCAGSHPSSDESVRRHRAVALRQNRPYDLEATSRRRSGPMPSASGGGRRPGSRELHAGGRSAAPLPGWRRVAKPSFFQGSERDRHRVDLVGVAVRGDRQGSRELSQAQAILLRRGGKLQGRDGLVIVTIRTQFSLLTSSRSSRHKE